MESLKSKVGKNEYRVIEIQKAEPIEMVRESDRIRFELAKTEPELCYVDTDCFISVPLHEYTIKGGIPYFSEHTFRETGYPDTFYFYVNGRTDFFQNFMDHVSPGYSLCFDFLKNLTGYEFIDTMSYYHQYSTMRTVVNSNKDGDIKKDLIVKVATMRKIVETMVMVINA
jgi:hypothetical protein